MVDAITDLSGLGLLSLKDTGSNPVLTTKGLSVYLVLQHEITVEYLPLVDNVLNFLVHKD